MSEQSNDALCQQFGVAIFRVGELYDTDEIGNALSDEVLQKFCVTTLAGSFDDIVKSIPLSVSVGDAEALAVKHLKLRELAT